MRGGKCRGIDCLHFTNYDRHFSKAAAEDRLAWPALILPHLLMVEPMMDVSEEVVQRKLVLPIATRCAKYQPDPVWPLHNIIILRGNSTCMRKQTSFGHDRALAVKLCGGHALDGVRL